MAMRKVNSTKCSSRVVEWVQAEEGDMGGDEASWRNWRHTFPSLCGSWLSLIAVCWPNQTPFQLYPRSWRRDRAWECSEPQPSVTEVRTSGTFTDCCHSYRQPHSGSQPRTPTALNSEDHIVQGFAVWGESSCCLIRHCIKSKSYYEMTLCIKFKFTLA